MDHLSSGNISLTLLKKPFKEFTIDVSDNSASTGYSQNIFTYTQNSLKYLGKEYTNVTSIPGKSVTLQFKFKPLKKVRSYVVIKTGRSWDSKTTSYRGFVIVFE
jgi:hypothetical protein